MNNLEARVAVLEAKLEGQKEAVVKAETASERRFESVNEFRQTLSDQQQMFCLKSEVNYRIEALEQRIGKNEAAISQSAGRGSGIGTASYVLFCVVTGLCGVAGVVLSILSKR